MVVCNRTGNRSDKLSFTYRAKRTHKVMRLPMQERQMEAGNPKKRLLPHVLSAAAKQKEIIQGN